MGARARGWLVLLGLTLVSVAAHAQAMPARRALVGTWQAVTGAPYMTLELRGDGTYVASEVASCPAVEGIDCEPFERREGVWRLDGDRLELRERSGPTRAFRVTLRRSELRLRGIGRPGLAYYARVPD